MSDYLPKVGRGQQPYKVEGHSDLHTSKRRRRAYLLGTEYTEEAEYLQKTRRVYGIGRVSTEQAGRFNYRPAGSIVYHVTLFLTALLQWWYIACNIGINDNMDSFLCLAGINRRVYLCWIKSIERSYLRHSLYHIINNEHTISRKGFTFDTNWTRNNK